MSLEKFNLNYPQEQEPLREEKEIKRELPLFQEEKKRVNFLPKLIEEIGKNFRFRGIPVDKYCRINMDSFVKLYGQKGKGSVSEDRIYIKERKAIFAMERQQEFQEKFPGEPYKKPLIGETIGEKMEMLKIVIFYKFLGEKRNCLVVRSSVYDDIKNGIDNVIFDVSSGEVVCAVDAVGSNDDIRYKIKMFEVFEKNKLGGGRLKYGMVIKRNEKNKLKIIPQEIKNIPKFFIGLPKESINKMINILTPS